MPRYIKEYEITTDGGKLTVPTCARWIGAAKVMQKFVLIAEIWGNDQLVHEIDVRVFHGDEYILPEAKYIGHAVTASAIFHFSYTAGEVEDLGGDGGLPEDQDNERPKPNEIMPKVRQAKGMRES